MTIAAVEYVTLDGRRYAVREGRFTRSHLISETNQIKARRSDSPFLDADVTAFNGGIKPDQMDDAADWIEAAVGLQPVGSGTGPNYAQLKLGMALDEQYTAAGAASATGLRALVSDAGWLFAGEAGAAANVLRSSDGTTWSAVGTGSGSTHGVSALGAKAGFLLAGFSDVVHPWFSTDHGATWAAYTLTNAGPQGITGTALIIPLGVENNAGSLPARWIVVSTTAGRAVGNSMSIDGSISGSTAVFLLAESSATAGCNDGSTAYFCGAETTNPIRGQLYSYQYGASANVSFLAPLEGNYATAMALYGGNVYLACALRGELYRHTGGSALELVRTFTTSVPIRGLLVAAGCLWAAVYNDTDGRLELWRYDGTGWSMPSYVTATLTAAGQVAGFSNTPYIAAGNGTTRKVYAVSGTNRVAAASITCAPAVYGAPALAKRYRAVLLQHAALAAGQYVEAWYALDGGPFTDLGTNRRVGATRTTFELPEMAVGGRLRARFTIGNGAAQDLTLYGGSVRALPAPDAREVWDCELILNSQVGFVWASDGAADNPDTIEKWDALAALHDRCAVFQAVDPFRSVAGAPRRALLATIDLQAELGADFSAVKVDGTLASTRVRILQAGGATNLLDNASFEQDAAGAHPTSWALSGTVPAWETDPAAFAIDGARVLTITYNGASATPSVYQAATVVAGRWYTVSGYLRRAGLAGGSAAAYLRVSEASVVIAGSETTHMAAGSDASLIRYQATFLVPAASSGTVAVECYASGTPTGTVYWDAIQLEAGAPASAFRERGA
jgi:hypothetical protein